MEIETWSSVSFRIADAAFVYERYYSKARKRGDILFNFWDEIYEKRISGVVMGE